MLNMLKAFRIWPMKTLGHMRSAGKLEVNKSLMSNLGCLDHRSHTDAQCYTRKHFPPWKAMFEFCQVLATSNTHFIKSK